MTDKLTRSKSQFKLCNDATKHSQRMIRKRTQITPSKIGLLYTVHILGYLKHSTVQRYSFKQTNSTLFILFIFVIVPFNWSALSVFQTKVSICRFCANQLKTHPPIYKDNRTRIIMFQRIHESVLSVRVFIFKASIGMLLSYFIFKLLTVSMK
jgi:hypothetical protein